MKKALLKSLSVFLVLALVFTLLPGLSQPVLAAGSDQDQEAPTELIGIAPTSENGTDGSITGTTTDMEYKSASGGDDYADCSEDSTIVGASGDYLVRYKAATGYNAGTPAVVTVPEYMTSVYVDGINGSDDNNGLTAETAVATLEKAIECCSSTEPSTVVIYSVVDDTDYFNIDKPVTITSAIDGTDFRDTNDAELILSMDYQQVIQLGADVTFRDIQIQGRSAYLYARGNRLTLGDGITCATDPESGRPIENFGTLYGGKYYYGQDSVSDHACISVSSGYVDRIFGSADGAEMMDTSEIHVTGGRTGQIWGGGNGLGQNRIQECKVQNSTIEVSGGYVGSIMGGANNGAVGDSIINISGGRVSAVTGMGYNSNLTDSCTINITGGRIGDVDCITSKVWHDDGWYYSYTNGTVNFPETSGTVSVSTISHATEVNIGTGADATADVALLSNTSQSYNNLGDIGSLTVNPGSSLYLKKSAELSGDLTANGTLGLGQNVCLTVDGDASGVSDLDISTKSHLGQVVLWVKSGDTAFSYSLTQPSQELTVTEGKYTLTQSPVSYWTDDGVYDESFYTDLTDGSVPDTVEVSDAAQLAAVAKALNDESVDFSGKTVSLTDNVDLDGHLWNPIGADEEHPFTGSFDGNGKTVVNMQISGEYDYAGLFGVANSGASIQDVSVGGEIELTDFIMAGGILGCSEADYWQYNGEKVSGCSSDVSIHAVSSVEPVDPDGGGSMYCVGGILGYGPSSAVLNCSNSGDISAEANGDVFAGGICGAVTLEGGIVNCYNVGSVSASSSGGENGNCTGGICGLVTNTDGEGVSSISISNCYSTGSISGGIPGAIVGGLYAIDDTDNYPDARMVFQNCYYRTGTAEAAYSKLEALYSHDEYGYVEGMLSVLPVDSRSEEGAMSGSDMQSAAFCQELNNWVKDNGPVSLLSFSDCQLSPWTTRSDQNDGYPVFVVTYSVSGTVEDHGGTAVAGAEVRVMQGKTQAGTTAVTDAGGKFTVAGVPDGEYNLVVTAGNHTVTKFITVMGQDYAAGIIVLPDDNKNSILDIQGNDTPDIVVNGLDQEAGAQSESTCTVTMTVEKKTASDAAIQSEASAIAILSGGKTVEYLKIDVTKTVGVDSTPLTSLSKVQEIIIPYDFSGKTDVTVYRYHGDAASALTSLSARPADLNSAVDGSFYADSANGKIYIYASQFSTYAIGYDTGSGGGGDDSGDNSGGHSGKHTIEAIFAKSTGLPYYLDSNSKVFIGFASDSSGTMKYIAPQGVTVQFMENQKNFTDIANHWGKSYIDFVTQREIFVGTGDNIFSPDTGMTRAMFAAVIGRLYERSYGVLPANTVHAFADVKYDDYYGKYVDWESENNIISGIGGGKFDPAREITREEMAAILNRFAEFLGAPATGYDETQLGYPDTSSISSWATEAAKYCQQTGIILGRDNGYFVPQGTATRAEVTAILQRFIELEVK